MSNRNIFLFGLAVGAWLNIWPHAIGPGWSFAFAYALVALSWLSLAVEKGWDR